MIRKTAAVIGSLGVALGLLTMAPAYAAGGYNATVAGQQNFTPLVNLATSSVQPVAVVNLPANVGLYGMHCKVPADPRQAPTLCDMSADAIRYLPAAGTETASTSFPLKVNGEFYGMNPNPTVQSAPASVDCRVPTGNPRSTTCAVYILGAGKESANPAYMRIFPTMFSPVRPDRKTDLAAVSLDGNLALRREQPKLTQGAAVPFSVKLKSGLTPSLLSDNCSVTGGKITALKSTGTCTVTITSTGGRNYKPIVQNRVFQLA
jgi:hypothetical protein